MSSPMRTVSLEFKLLTFMLYTLCCCSMRRIRLSGNEASNRMWDRMWNGYEKTPAERAGVKRTEKRTEKSSAMRRKSTGLFFGRLCFWMLCPDKNGGKVAADEGNGRSHPNVQRAVLRAENPHNGVHHKAVFLIAADGGANLIIGDDAAHMSAFF